MNDGHHTPVALAREPRYSSQIMVGALHTIASWLRSLWPFGGHLRYPERRRGTRYLTLKNAARAVIVLVVAFFLLSLWASFRPAHSGAGLGESRGASVDSPPVREPVPVIEEGSTHDYPQTDSIGDEVPAAPTPPPARESDLDRREPRPQLGNGQRVVISGGREGVSLHVDPAPAPAAPSPPRSSTER